MKAILSLGVLGAIAYFAFTILLPYDETWLHGEWQYQGDDIDFMTFKSNGTVELRTDKRVYARCVYAVVVKDEVSMECKIRDKVHEFVFAVSDDKRTLTNTEHADSVYGKTGR